MRARRDGWLLVAGLLGGCAGFGEQSSRDLERDVQSAVDRAPSPVGLQVCHGYGCFRQSLVTLSAQEWRELRALFLPAAADAAAERARIGQAIGLIERFVGPRAGTSHDKPGTPAAMDDPGQLDCVDEAINTSTYLHLLTRSRLLNYHEVLDVRRRTRYLGLAQHYTAVIRDGANGREYAVDSWFHANGQPAEIVPLEEWLAGWEPPAGSREARR